MKKFAGDFALRCVGSVLAFVVYFAQIPQAFSACIEKKDKLELENCDDGGGDGGGPRT